MQELSAVMRSIEIYRLSLESKLTGIQNDVRRQRGHSVGHYSRPHQRNFQRNFQKKRNSAEVDRILAKYAYLREASTSNNPPATIRECKNTKEVEKSTDATEKCARSKLGSFSFSNMAKNLTDSDKITLRKSKEDKCNASNEDVQSIKSYDLVQFQRSVRRKVVSCFVNYSEKDRWKFKSFDGGSKTKLERIDSEPSMDVIFKKVAVVKRDVSNNSSKYPTCSSNSPNCSSNAPTDTRDLNDVPKRMKSLNFLEESILQRPKSGNWELPIKSCASSVINEEICFAKERRVDGAEILKKWWRPKLAIKKGKMFDCWVKWRRRRIDPSRPEIQEIDDGFFEKFGSLLRQQSVKAAMYESTPLAPLIEEPTISEEPVQTPSDATVVGEAPPEDLTTDTQLDEADRSSEKAVQLQPRFGLDLDDSGNETLHESDSEPDVGKLEWFEGPVGWNIDELYKEILYEIIHNLGSDGCVEIGQLPLLAYVQDAFKISTERHRELMAEAEAKEPPDIMLNVEVIEAKDLHPKDANGLSDPFVTMYLLSNPTQRYNTSVKAETLSPMWEEHFSLPVSETPGDDTLCLEVWDFDPAETVKEKMGKIFEVKGVKGLRKLMKEIAVTASTGKHDNELIGRASIPLKSIPTSGMTMWYSLDKKNKLRRQGVVKVRLSFSSEKNSQVATQEHRHLLRILLLHELEHSQVAHYWWSGNYSVQAEAIIQQHAALSGLGQNEIALAQWTVFCAIHAEHPLSFSLFNSLIAKLTKPLQSEVICEEENKLFWDGARKIFPSCFSKIRKIRKQQAGDKTVLKSLRDVLTIFVSLADLKIPESVDIFPANVYGWLKRTDDKPICDIIYVLKEACLQGASEWFIHILENNECKDKSEEGRLQHLIRVIQLVRSDLQRTVEYYDKVFSDIVRFSYAKSLYILYQSKISELVEPEVLEVCKSMKRLRYSDDSHRKVTLADASGEATQLGGPKLQGEPLAMGTTLFELYLVLQRFLALGQGLCPVDWNQFSISKFHNWFFGGVAQWLDIAVFKALTRIEKAVELDQLVPVDATVKYSSSAVDTLAIFYQIKVFWQQLAWPDVEGSYTFVAKIVDDICRCCVFYADNMSARVEGMGEVTTIYEKKFQVTTEWCLAINNIDYVRQSLQPFVEELGMVDIISRLGELRSPVEAQRCKETLENVVENAIDTVRNKIIELLEKVVRKMMPSLSRFLMEGAELLHQDCSSLDRVMLYLEENLDVLHSQLNTDNFTRTLDVIWDQLSQLLFQLVETNLEKRRPPSFFSNLHQCLKIMVQSFKQDNTESQSNETLARIEHLLQLHGFETTELIHQYFVERWQEQQTLQDSPFGMLSVRALFTESTLVIEVMNARNLLAMDSNGSVDSFVRIHLLPEDLFAGCIRPKTQTHNKNQFPLYDEVFRIVLTPEQRKCKDGLIVFDVKDKDMFGMSNQYLAEAYLHFKEVPDTETNIKDLPQVHLKLSRPTKLEGDAVKSLEHRQGDKQAREFLKKQKQKIGLPH